MPAPVARLFVFLDVEVDCEDSHRLGHNEGKRAEVEGPAIVVLVLAVLVLLVAGITRVAGDVDNDSDDVAQTWRRRDQWQMVTWYLHATLRHFTKPVIQTNEELLLPYKWLWVQCRFIVLPKDT